MPEILLGDDNLSGSKIGEIIMVNVDHVCFSAINKSHYSLDVTEFLSCAYRRVCLAEQMQCILVRQFVRI